MFIRRVSNKLRRIKDYLCDYIVYKCLEKDRPKESGLLRIILRGRKLVGFYGECHMYIYGGYLSSVRELKKYYYLLGAKEIEYLVRWHSTRINNRNVWNKLDVLIYNPGVPDRKGAPSLGAVLEWIPDNCKRIEVTNAVFKGYMPQHTEKVFKNDQLFIWGDKNINKLLNEKESESKLEELLSESFYDPQFVIDYFEKSIKRLKQYEQRCTIKIADYIEENGKKRPLFYSVTHPEDEIMRELTLRIMNELGLERRELRNTSGQAGLFDLHTHGEVIYPSVCKALGFSNEVLERTIHPGSYKNLDYTFEKYVKEYYRMGKEIAEQ